MSKYLLKGRNVNAEWQELGEYHLKITACLKAYYWIKAGWQICLRRVSK